MLGHRLRSGAGAAGSGGGGGPVEEGAANGLLSWGSAKSGVLGGGYHSLTYFPYPQGVVGLSNVVHLANGQELCVLDRAYNIWTVGGKGGSGSGIRLVEAGGSAERKEEEEAEGGEAALPFINWYHVTGRTPSGEPLPLYPEETLKTKTTTLVQPVGPPAVPLPSKADHDEGRSSWYVIAVAAGSSHCLALTSDGRVLSWGANGAGELGVGWEFTDTKAVAMEPSGQWPTYAPGWVQSSGPGPQVPDPRHAGVPEAQHLKGVLAIAATGLVSYFLMTTGEVYFAGGPQGSGASPHFFAEKDTLWKPDLSNKPIAIAGTKKGYLLLLKDGTTRYVGQISEYCAGNGVLQSKSTNTREVATPLLADKTPVGGVIAIAKGDFSLKLLKSNGVVYTAGGNLEGQQGVAGFGHEEPQQYCVPMPALNAGLRKVVAISGNGEIVHGLVAPYQRLTGANGGDSYLYMLDDTSIRCSAVNWAYESGSAERFIGIGAMGTGTSENHLMPQEPVGALRNISQICAGMVHQLVLQEPGAPAAPTLTTTVIAAGTVRVDWSDPPGAAVGSMPLWREEAGWQVVLTGTTNGLRYASPVLANRDGEGNRIRTYTFAGVAPGETYEAKVFATTSEALPEVIGNPNVLSGAPNPLPLTPITSLPVAALPEALLRGTPVVVASGGHTQTFTTSASIEAGATFIPIVSATPNFAYPSGSSVHADGALKVAGTAWGAVKWGTFAWGATAPLPIVWTEAPSPEPTFFVEYQHRGVVRQKGAVVFSLGGSTPLPTNAAVTSLTVSALPEPIGALEIVRVKSGGHEQVFDMLKAAVKGATTLLVRATVPSFAFPPGSEVDAVHREDWKRVEPDIDGGEGNATILVPPASLSGVTGSDVHVRVFGSYGGAYKTRIREISVPGTPPPPPPPAGVQVKKTPTGPPTPTGGWSVAYADGFGVPIGTGAGEDASWYPNSDNGEKPTVDHPGGNANETCVFNASQVSVDSEGLQLTGEPVAGLGGNKLFRTGIVTGTADKTPPAIKPFRWKPTEGKTMAFEIVCKLPPNTDEADPSFWCFGPLGAWHEEIDFFEAWGYGSGSTQSSGYTKAEVGNVWIYKTEEPKLQKNTSAVLGFDPTLAFHRYTFVLFADNSFSAYIDGVVRPSCNKVSPAEPARIQRVMMGLSVEYAMREAGAGGSGFTTGKRKYTVRSVAVYEDTPHAGVNTENPGVVPGTELVP